MTIRIDERSVDPCVFQAHEEHLARHAGPEWHRDELDIPIHVNVEGLNRGTVALIPYRDSNPE